MRKKLNVLFKFRFILMLNMKKGKLIEYLKFKWNYVYKIYKINVFVKIY